MRELRDKRVLVAGMGKSGLAAVELLLRKGASVRAVDERPPEALGSTADRLRTLGVSLLPQVDATFADPQRTDRFYHGARRF